MRVNQQNLKERIEVKLYAVVHVDRNGKVSIGHIFKSKKGALNSHYSRYGQVIELIGELKTAPQVNYSI